MRRAEIEERDLQRVQLLALEAGHTLRVATAINGEATFTLSGLGDFSELRDVERLLTAPVPPSDWYRLADTWSVQLSYRRGRIHALWNKARPPRPSQRAKFEALYQEALADFVAEVQRRVGVAVIAVDA